MDKQSFINSIKEGALKGQKDYGILPSLTIAQAILESGWGESILSRRANNLFGVKAFSDWDGGSISMPTTEWYGGERQVVNADFRSYSNFNDSIEDHNKLLTYPRYALLKGLSGYKEACEAVYQCGYATDPQYPAKLIRIIEENRLYEFDSLHIGKEVAATVTEGKIQRFQHLCNVLNIRDYEGKALTEDNIIGPRTRSCIEKMPTLMKGSISPVVEFVQKIVGAAPVDGDFGPITEQCVMEYQIIKGIIVDGIVGRQTWETIVNT